MKTMTFRLLGAGLLLAGVAVSASANAVLSPAKRQEALEQGKSLVATKEIVPVTADPFNPPAFAELAASLGRGAGPVAAPETPGTPVPVGPRGDRELLQAIAQGLKPSGYIVLGGQASLSFGQKRVKAGGTLTITFEGSQYTLEVVSIDRANFTLRLNREEFTRTIK